MDEETTIDQKTDDSSTTEGSTILGDGVAEAAETKATDAEGTTESAATEEKGTGAPEAYELEGLEGESLSDLTAYARANELTNDQAQALVTRDAEMQEKFAAHTAEQFEKTKAEWKASFEADPAIGGTNAEKTVSNAVLAMDKFADPEFSKMLKETGLGSHPEVIRLLSNIGAVMAEGKILGAETPAKPNKDKTLAEIMYPDMA